MSIFARKQNDTTTVDVPVYEGYGVEVNGDILALTESFDDQLHVVKTLHAIEMEELNMRRDVQSLQESSADESEIESRIADFETVTESMVKDGWEKIKAFFNKLWGKIKAFFASVVRYFDGMFKSAEDFAKKYEAQLKKLSLKDFKAKVFSYTNLESGLGRGKSEVEGYFNAVVAAATSSESGLDAMEDVISKMKDERDDQLDNFRGKMVGESSLSTDQYKQALFAYFRNGARGSDDKKEINVDIQSVINTLKDKDARKIAQDFMKETETEFSNLLKKIDGIKSKIGSSKEKDGKYEVKVTKDKTHSYSSKGQNVALEALRTYGSLFSSYKDIQLEGFRSWREAIAERDSAFKSICKAAFGHKVKKDA